MLGEQQPRIHCVPPYVSSAGVEAVEMCRLIGLTLDPWQERCLTDALGERADGTWSAFQVGVCAPRQNGKNVGTAEPRELVGLFLLDEPLITHSAHEFKTAMESFRRTKAIIEGTPEFSRRVKRVIESHGDEGIELKPRPVSSVGTGRLIRPPSQRLQYRTRTKGGGRGFSGNLLVLDEAMILPEAAMGALLFTLSAQINPQVWLLGSAVDRRLHEYGLVFSRMRRAALSGADPRLMFLEFSSAHSLQRLLADPSLADEVAIAQANPAYGRRVMAEFIASERGDGRQPDVVRGEAECRRLA